MQWTLDLYRAYRERYRDIPAIMQNQIDKEMDNKTERTVM